MSAKSAAAWTAAPGNRERANAAARARYAANAEARRGARRARKAADPEYARKHREYVDPAVVWARDCGVCHICDRPADPEDWHLEHVVPLARGGNHSYANTRVSHPVCNLRKGAR